MSSKLVFSVICDTGAGAVDADDVGTVDADAVDIDITLISR